MEAFTVKINGFLQLSFICDTEEESWNAFTDWVCEETEYNDAGFLAAHTVERVSVNIIELATAPSE